MAHDSFQGRSFLENPLPIVTEVINNSNEDTSDPGKSIFLAVSDQEIRPGDCLNTAVLVSGKALAAGFLKRITRG